MRSSSTGCARSHNVWPVSVSFRPDDGGDVAGRAARCVRRGGRHAPRRAGLPRSVRPVLAFSTCVAGMQAPAVDAHEHQRAVLVGHHLERQRRERLARGPGRPARPAAARPAAPAGSRTTASSSGSMPLFLNAAPASTGTNVPASVPSRMQARSRSARQRLAVQVGRQRRVVLLDHGFDEAGARGLPARAARPGCRLDGGTAPPSSGQTSARSPPGRPRRESRPRRRSATAAPAAARRAVRASISTDAREVRARRGRAC